MGVCVSAWESVLFGVTVEIQIFIFSNPQRWVGKPATVHHDQGIFDGQNLKRYVEVTSSRSLEHGVHSIPACILSSDVGNNKNCITF